MQFVRFKVESAGAEIVLVDPRGTSQTCPKCGMTKVKRLAILTYACGCGAVLDRDVAAAMVVHQLAPGRDTVFKT